MANFSFKTTGLPEPVNGIIEGHNFTQGRPHTKIYEGYSELTFRNCNLLNCDVPSDSVVISCGLGHVSFCSHLHPKWLENGFVFECVESCEHLVSVDTITIDGILLNTQNHYEDSEVE